MHEQIAPLAIPLGDSDWTLKQRWKLASRIEDLLDISLPNAVLCEQFRIKQLNTTPYLLHYQTAAQYLKERYNTEMDYETMRKKGCLRRHGRKTTISRTDLNRIMYRRAHDADTQEAFLHGAIQPINNITFGGYNSAFPLLTVRGYPRPIIQDIIQHGNYQPISDNITSLCPPQRIALHASH